MTPGDIAQIITALVLLGGFFLSMRSTSYNELKGLFDSLKKDFDEYKRESKDREKEYEDKIEAMEKDLTTMTRQNANFKRYIAKLIAQLEAAKIIPEPMQDDL